MHQPSRHAIRQGAADEKGAVASRKTNLPFAGDLSEDAPHKA